MRLLKLREHRARLLAASHARVHQGADTADEIFRRRLIVRASGQIRRIETALGPLRSRPFPAKVNPE